MRRFPIRSIHQPYVSLQDLAIISFTGGAVPGCGDASLFGLRGFRSIPIEDLIHVTI
ncbi:hypothetical protein CCP3SC1_440008 [Gammaproteobacteria bacterium]